MRKGVPSLVRSVVAVLALVGYLTAALGVPLPAPPSTPSTLSEPAVEARPCGCVVSPCEGSACCCGPAPIEIPLTDSPIVWFIGEQVRKCHGLETLWLSIGIALPMPPAVQVAPEAPLSCRLDRMFSPFDTHSSRPIAPPPRA